MALAVPTSHVRLSPESLSEGAMLGVPESLEIEIGLTRYGENLSAFRFDEPAPPAHFTSTAVCVCVVGQGTAEAEVGGRRYLCPADSYIVKAWVDEGFETEILEASAKTPFVGSLIEFSPREVVRAMEDIQRCSPNSLLRDKLWAPTAYVQEATPAFHELVASLASCVISGSHLDKSLLLPLRRRELLYLLLLPLLGSQDNRLLEPDEDSPVLPHSVVSVQPAIELLTKDLSKPLRVADLARAVNISPSRFAHVFKESTGVSPHRFRKQLRMEHARHLLEEKGWAVTTVAVEVGYSNVSHFISEFKRIFGMTPGSYLARNAIDDDRTD